MLIFLIVLVLLLFVVPRLVVIYARWKLRQHAERMQQQFNDIFGGGTTAGPRAGRTPRSKDGWERPGCTSKKYSPSDGEYVEFEEIDDVEVTDTTSADTETDTAAAHYQRIEDTTWEDIK